AAGGADAAAHLVVRVQLQQPQRHPAHHRGRAVPGGEPAGGGYGPAHHLHVQAGLRHRRRPVRLRGLDLGVHLRHRGARLCRGVPPHPQAGGGVRVKLAFRHAFVLVVCAFAIFPILFVVSAAINPLGTLASTELLPTGASFTNFGELLTSDVYPFGRWFFNSVFIALLSSFASLLLSMFAAYAFSRMRFAGRRVGLLALLLIQMFPQFLAIVTIFMIFTEVTELYPAFGFDTVWGLMLLYLGGALGVNTWLMKGFLDTVP